MGLAEQADGYSGKVKTALKKLKVRTERRRAKKKPDVLPAYGKYSGYQL
ncbi:MAG: hypothetical protein M0R80_01325 [Proteobacteria bacterium]|jgi:hypothetical protein|nr:hypothetical protein [Pseudomonadota bacterium]